MQDPTESTNLAASNKPKLQELLDFYNTYAAKPDTVMGLSWRYGFQDPDAGTVPPDPEGQHCTGSFNANGGSPYCHFGREWECFVSGREPGAGGTALGNAPGTVATTAACQAACAAKAGCEWWVLRNSTSAASSPSSTPAVSSSVTAAAAAATTTTTCELIGKGSDGTQPCVGGSTISSTTCEMGPSACPGMSDAPAAAQQQLQPLQGGEASSSGRRVTMTDATVAALVDAETVGPPATAAYDLKGETTLAALGRLDDAGYFNSGM